MKIGLYYTEDISGTGIHKQIADTYEYDNENDGIMFTKSETDYTLSTDRVVTIPVFNDDRFVQDPEA